MATTRRVPNKREAFTLPVAVSMNAAALNREGSMLTPWAARTGVNSAMTESRRDVTSSVLAWYWAQRLRTTAGFPLTAP